MTILYVVGAVLVLRVLEIVVSSFIRWFRSPKTVEKTYSYKRISAIVSPELHERLKAHVVLLNMTITDYILLAISEKLKREEAQV